MAKRVPKNPGLEKRVRSLFPVGKEFCEKRMFGGSAFFLNGHVCVAVWKDSLIARVGPPDYEVALREPYVKEFDVTGRPMKGWVMALPEGIEDDDLLSGWIARSLDFVSGLPAKAAVKKKAAGKNTNRRRGRLD